MEAKLVVVGGDAQAGEYQLTLPTVVGRSRRADLKLPHPLVSRQHCELYETDGVLMVRDLGSLNGTFVGDARITIETVLEPGDLLTIGSVTFRAVYGGASDLPGSVRPAAEQAKPAATAGPAAEAKSAKAKQSAAVKKQGAKEKTATQEAAADEKPAEIELTHQAGGLAALEQLRGSEAEVQDEPSAPAISEPTEDFNFNWLEDSEPENEALAKADVETEEVPDSGAAQKSRGAKSGAPDAADEQPESQMVDLGDLDVEVEDSGAVDPAKVAEIADEVAASEPVDETQTIRVEEALTGAEESEPSAPAKPGNEAVADDDGLDDFFKSLE